MGFLVNRPFKGLWFYEWQVGPWVLQFKHDKDHKPSGRAFFTLGNFQIWTDSCWRLHMLEMPKWMRRRMYKLQKRLRGKPPRYEK